MMTALEKAARAAWAKKFGVPFTAITETQWADVFRDEWMSVIQAAFEAIQPIGAPFAGRAGIAAIIHDIVDSDLDGNLVHVDKASDAILAMLAASPQEAVPTKREAALADLAKLDGETMDLAASPQGEGGPPTRGGVVGDLDLYDDKVQAGISWTMRQWGEALGLTTWTQGDGSESVEGDVGAEIHTILIDAGLRDPETNEMVRVKALAQKIDILRRADTEGVKP